jgi:MFS family permease
MRRLTDFAAAVVVDLFFRHERGVKMGIYAVFITQGGHLAALIGGYIAQYAGFQWNYKYANSIVS